MKKESLLIRFLYNTLPGRVVLKQMVKPGVSDLVGYFLKSKYSRIIIPFFIQKNHIDMGDYIIPDGGYGSFNDFFIRKQKAMGRKPVASGLVSPCDGLLTVMDINEDSVFEIKNSKYALNELIRNRKLAGKYANGTAMIFRLTPAHYHRYCYCTDGHILALRGIRGVLHCVRPVALGREKVYIHNTREYTVLKSENLGTVIQMEVGALLVGKIHNHEIDDPCQWVTKGTEKGYFEYGGSTIILLFEHRIPLSPEISARRREAGEIPVTMGEALMAWKRISE